MTRRDRHGYHQVGADGTPEISEFAAVELGMLLETTTGSAEVLLRDALDLRHRMPRVWDAVMTGRLEDWKARKVVTAVRPLAHEDALRVDADVVEAVVGLPFGRALDVVHGRVIAADPDGARARRAAEEQRRYVATGRRSNPHGLRTLIAQTTSGDVARIEAMVAHLARLLGAAGDTDDADTRRAKALGLLANPALACVVLAHSGAETESAEPSEELRQLSPVELAARFGRLLVALGGRALDRLRPTCVLYVHLSEEAVAGMPGTQVARLEGGGPINLTDLASLVGHDRIVVKPVIDPSGAEPADGYELPTDHREKLRLRTPFEVFPFGTQPADRADQDHSVPYRPLADGGPPGQTRLENLGPLGRRHHRAKTFGRFTLVQPLPGLYLWRSPTRHWFRVDHRGTTALGRDVPDIVRQLQPPVLRPAAATENGGVSPMEQRLADLVGDQVLAS